MSEHESEPHGLTEDELDAQDGEPLPAREAMSVVEPTIGRLPPLDDVPVDQLPDPKPTY